MKKVITSLSMTFPAFVVHLSASPLADLSSPDQGVRDKAAAEMRVTYQDINESKWAPVISSLKEGQSEADVLEILRPYNVTMLGEIIGGGVPPESYRLDDAWMLTCWYAKAPANLVMWKFEKSVRDVWIAPPKDFTGRWVAYYVNGQKRQQIDYKNGEYSGDWISYYANGSISFIQHYCDMHTDPVVEVGYYPSGKLMYRGQYREGKFPDKWTRYDEEGNISSIEGGVGTHRYSVTFSATNGEKHNGDLRCDGAELPLQYEHVITPIGEFVVAKEDPTPGWQRVEKGSIWGGKTSSTVSIEACLAGDFEYPPSGVGEDWLYVVGKNLWVNTAKMEEVAKELVSHSENK
jgi:hypothetical protein